MKSNKKLSMCCTWYILNFPFKNTSLVLQFLNFSNKILKSKDSTFLNKVILVILMKKNQTIFKLLHN